MKILLIDFGVPEEHRPKRAHDNDTGADVFMPYDCTLPPGHVETVHLGFGIALPDGMAGFVFPRSSMAAKGLTCELPPIDPGYRGQIHAIISNVSSEVRHISKGERIGQIVLSPVIVADFVMALGEQRETGCFGSTGK